MRRIGRHAHPPSAKLEKIRIEQECRLLGAGRACRTSARAIAADGLACGVIALPAANYTRTHHMRFLRGAGVIRVRAKGTRRIARLRGDDPDALYPGLLDPVLAAQHQMARPATMPGRHTCVDDTLQHWSVTYPSDGNQRHKEG